MSIRAFVVAGLLCLVSLASCQQVSILRPWPPDLARAWVATEPIQCLGNPWEQDWLASHDNDYASYPKDPTKPGLESAEVEIIKDYYRRQGVTVFEVAAKGRYGVVCLACSCPEGYTLYLDVRQQDVPKMISLGYRQESP